MNEFRKLETELRKWGENVDQAISQEIPEFNVPELPAAASLQGEKIIWMPRLITAAACLMLCVGAFGLFSARKPKKGTKHPLIELAGVYAEVVRLFPDQAVWMRLDAGQVEMGVDPQAGELEGGIRLVLRVEVQSREESGTWRSVWQNDLITSDKAWVDIASPDRPEERLAVWTHSPSEGMVLLESFLDLAAPHGLSNREQILFKLSSNQPASHETQIGPRLRMIQTVMELDDGGQGA